MKKGNTLLIVMAIAAIILAVAGMASCKKNNETVTVIKQVDVSLLMNTAYTYSLPALGDADDMPEISKQAAHYVSSTLAVDAAARTSVLNYMPAQDYVGTDEIQVNPVETSNNKAGRGGPGGNCGHNGVDTAYLFKITISKIK